jgi:hypothetical protein
MLKKEKRIRVCFIVQSFVLVFVIMGTCWDDSVKSLGMDC